MYVNVVFVVRRVYSAVSLTLAREQRFIRIIIIMMMMITLFVKGQQCWPLLCSLAALVSCWLSQGLICLSDGGGIKQHTDTTAHLQLSTGGR